METYLSKLWAKITRKESRPLQKSVQAVTQSSGLSEQQEADRAALIELAYGALMSNYFSRYEEAHGSEITAEIRTNASILCHRVAGLLIDIGSRSIAVSSGWRPSAINKMITGAAKKSYHMSGKAIDLVDTREQELARKIESRPDLLDKHQLWMEDRSATPGWTHLDIGERSPRKIRIFKP